MPRTRAKKYEYLLGDSSSEAARLRRQARLWDPVAHALFDRLKIRPGQRVLEVGPGQGSLHMELRRRVGGPVDAVERSAPFADRLARLVKRDGLGKGQLWRTDLIDTPLPENHYDVIFARWVFLFLPDLDAHVRHIARALKPGGVLAIQDYQRDTMTMVPPLSNWHALVESERLLYAARGADISVGGALPALCEQAGLEVREVVPTVKIGSPGSETWWWVTTYFLGMLDQYAQFPPFTPAAAATMRREWLRAGEKKTSVFIAPAVVDVVARKPKRK